MRHVKPFAVVLLLIAFAAAPAFAQLTLTVRHDVDPYSLRYDVTIQNKTEVIIEFFESSIINEARLGSSDGPLVWWPVVSSDVSQLLYPGETLEHPWWARDTAGVPLDSGNYWLRVSYRVLYGTEILHQWVDVDHVVVSPILRPFGDPVLGATVPLRIMAPLYPGAPYIAAAARDILNPEVHTGMLLIPDWLTWFSLVEPDGALFTGFQGTLDPDGIGWNLAVSLPSDPVFAGYTFSVQAYVGSPPVVAPGGMIMPERFTNHLTLTIAWPE